MFPVVALICGATACFKDYLSVYCGVRILIGIRARLYQKVQALPLSFFCDMWVGDFLSRGS